MKSLFKDHSGYKELFISIALWAIGFGLYKGILDNYLAEVVCMTQFDRGITEFFRELPGVLLILLLALLFRFSAEKIYKIGAVIMVVGMLMQSIITPTKILVIVAIFIYSLGEHIQLGMKNTLTLEYSKEGKGGRALGYQNAIGQIGNLVGYIIVMFTFLFFSSGKLFRPFFFCSTILIAVSMLFSLKLSGNSKTDENKSRFYFRKKFTKFYMLEIFYGARKQVFFTFGPYVLILFYGADAAIISLLFAISAISCFILAPFVGKLIDKIGYKPVMVGDTLILVVVCFFYGFAHHLFPMRIAFVVCCINYVLDSVISLAAMASNVYVQDISSDGNEMRATISTGISVNHFISIFIALFGGWIWQTLGIETLFLISAGLGLCNSAYAATIKNKQ